MMPNVVYIIRYALIAFVIKVPFGILGAYLVNVFGLHNPIFSAVAQEPTFTFEDIVLAIVLAPFIETVIAQLVPLEVCRRLFKSTKVCIVLSASFFMLMHYPVVEFFPSAFAVGCVLAWCWMDKRELGLAKITLLVTLIHSLHNALVAAFGALVW